MEIQGQEKDMRVAGGGSLSFAHLGLDSSAEDDITRRGTDGNHNNCIQSMDHHQQQPYLLQQQHQRNISTAAAAPVGHGSSFKSSSSKATRYRECLRNHAASVGGSALDGCGEFMPGGEEGTLEALKCAACDCHRNFHRKEIEGDHRTTQYSGVVPRRSLMISPLQLPPPPLPPPPTMHHHHPHQNYSMVTPMSVAFGGGCSGGTDQSSSEELNVLHSNAHEGFPGSHSQPPPPYALSKKRFRTKFTQEQKEKMMEFAEELGWKFLRQDDEKIERFCADTGIKRQVFKVWMHNNKNSARKQLPPPPPPPSLE